MDFQTIEQVLMNEAALACSTSYTTYVDQFDAYFTGSDSNEDQAHSPPSPTSPTSPSSFFAPSTPLLFSPGFIKTDAGGVPTPSLSDTVPSTPSLSLSTPQSEGGKRRGSGSRKMRKTNRDTSQSDDDEERREKVKNSEKKRRDRLSFWFSEIQKLLLPTPTASEGSSEQEKIAYTRKKRELRKEDILEMTTTHLQENKNRIRMLCRVLAKLSLDNQLNFASFTQEDISTAFDAIYGQLQNDRDANTFRTLLNTLYTLAKKSSLPQHEIVVLEVSNNQASKTSPTASPSVNTLSPQVPKTQLPFLNTEPMPIPTEQKPTIPQSPVFTPLVPPSPVFTPDSANTFLAGTAPEWGKYFYPDGSVYEGEWRGGKAHGHGTLMYATGDRYVGEWVATQKHGKGDFIYANGDVYHGEWKADRANGYGVLVYANGSKYLGSWVDDKRHGQGVFEDASGMRYEGEWVNGRKEGKGVLHFPSGDTYTGVWKNGVAVSGVYAFRAGSPWANPDF